MFKYQHTDPLKDANDNHIGKLYHKEVTNEQYIRHHTIILDSHDRRAGSTRQKAVFDLFKPVDIMSPKSVLFVDSFVMNDASLFGSNYYYIKIKEIAQPMSYSSENKSLSDIVVATKGATYFNNNGLGMIPIFDKNVFRGKAITIELYCRDVDVTALASDWTLKLVILEQPYQ